MTTILDQIADRTRQRMADEEAVLPTEALAAQARALADFILSSMSRTSTCELAKNRLLLNL